MLHHQLTGTKTPDETQDIEMVHAIGGIKHPSSLGSSCLPPSHGREEKDRDEMRYIIPT